MQYDAIPAWIADKEGIGPCPCGYPMMGPIAIIRSDRGLKTAYHYPQCLWRRKGYEELDAETEIDWKPPEDFDEQD